MGVDALLCPRREESWTQPAGPVRLDEGLRCTWDLELFLEAVVHLDGPWVHIRFHSMFHMAGLPIRQLYGQRESRSSKYVLTAGR